MSAPPQKSPAPMCIVYRYRGGNAQSEPLGEARTALRRIGIDGLRYDPNGFERGGLHLLCVHRDVETHLSYPASPHRGWRQWGFRIYRRQRCQFPSLSTSTQGGARGGGTNSGGTGVRCKGRCPHWGHWVMSVPVNCQTHSAAVFFSRGGGSGDTARSFRRMGSAFAFERLARNPTWRSRWKPKGNTCKNYVAN